MFRLVVVAALALAGLFGLAVAQPQLLIGLVGQELGGHVSHHFREPHHRIHDLAFALLLGTSVLGLLVQLRAPARNIAAQAMALVPIIALVLMTAVTNTAVLQLPWIAIGAFTLLAATLHPAGRGFFRYVRVSRMDRPTLALVLVATPPLLLLAWTNIGLQRSGPSEHAALGHYGFLAAFSLTVIGSGLLASLRAPGRRLSAWVTGLLPALLGVASLIAIDADSRLELVWALAAIAWGVAFIILAELTRLRSEEPEELHVASPSPAAPASAWVYVAGIIVIAVVLFAVMHMTSGGGPALHGTPAGSH